jgi:hypothetical protein
LEVEQIVDEQVAAVGDGGVHDTRIREPSVPYGGSLRRFLTEVHGSSLTVIRGVPTLVPHMGS